MGAVAARLAAAEAELDTARGGRTLAEAKIEKLQHYVQVRRTSGGEGLIASGGSKAEKLTVLWRAGLTWTAWGAQKASDKVKQLSAALEEKGQTVERLEREAAGAAERAAGAAGLAARVAEELEEARAGVREGAARLEAQCEELRRAVEGVCEEVRGASRGDLCGLDGC